MQASLTTRAAEVAATPVADAAAAAVPAAAAAAEFMEALQQEGGPRGLEAQKEQG